MKEVIVTFVGHVNPEADLEDVGARMRRLIASNFKECPVLLRDQVYVEPASDLADRGDPDCGSCAAVVAADSDFCPHCGNKMD